MNTVSIETSEGEDGLRRLAASAALIKASLCGALSTEDGRMASPELRIGEDGEIHAWIKTAGGVEDIELFAALPSKFGQLTFGFACDHFKMLHGSFWRALSAKASDLGHPVVVAVANFNVGENLGLEEARPERMTAPALMEMCKRMATTPGWLMAALDDLEKGRAPSPPLAAGKKPRSMG